MKSSLLPGGTSTPAPTGTPVASTTGFSVMQPGRSTSAARTINIRAGRAAARVALIASLQGVREKEPRSDRAALGREMLEDEDAGADRRALVEVDHVLVQHADAAGRDVGADRPRLGRAVDAVDEVLAVAVEVVGARSERIVRPALPLLRQVRAARQHLGRRHPIGPHRLAADLGAPEPLEALAPDADAVAERGVVLEGDVESVAPGVDDEAAGRLLVDVFHELAPVAGGDLLHVGLAERESVVVDEAVEIGLLGRRLGRSA